VSGRLALRTVVPCLLLVGCMTPGQSGAPGASTPASEGITTSPSQGVASASPASPALREPDGLAIDASGAVYVSDHGGYVYRIAAGGALEVVAGNGSRGFAGDGGAATRAAFSTPAGIAFDSEGRLLVVDHENHRIRRVDATGVISTIVGSGSTGQTAGGFAGDGGPALEAQLHEPIAVARAGAALYISDSRNARIRAVDASGVISTIAGDGGVTGLKPLALDGPATEATLAAPVFLVFNSVGDLVFTDRGLNRVLSIHPDGTLTLLAGSGARGFAGDGGPAGSAQLTEPAGIAIDASDNLYIGDAGNHRIRRVAPDGVITTVAGTGTAGLSGDGGPAIDAEIDTPFGLAVDSAGNLYFADFANGHVRRIDTAGVITTVAGG